MPLFKPCGGTGGPRSLGEASFGRVVFRSGVEPADLLARGVPQRPERLASFEALEDLPAEEAPAEAGRFLARWVADGLIAGAS